MSDTSKPKRTLSEEQKTKMQAAAKAAREKRDAEEAANPALKVERLAKAKEKRESKKVDKAADVETDSSAESDKPKRTLSEEQKAKMQAAAKAAREKRDAEEAANPALKVERLAKAKAKRESKKK